MCKHSFLTQVQLSIHDTEGKPPHSDSLLCLIFQREGTELLPIILEVKHEDYEAKMGWRKPLCSWHYPNGFFPPIEDKESSVAGNESLPPGSWFVSVEPKAAASPVVLPVRCCLKWELRRLEVTSFPSF